MSLETLKNKRKELVENLDALQMESAERLFEIKLDDHKQVKTIMEHLNKGFTWKTQNAAVIVALYDQLKKQGKELVTSEEATVIKLRAHELNGLYQALLNVEGQGVENARRFITMLTNVGETVTTAMTALGEMNKEISKMHTELDQLDNEIATLENAEEVEPVLEPSEENQA